ncbi:phosphatidylinositol-glycan biosynthesis class X protein isoform X2 [Colius striatus]|uniref:phosphatidylinositol-glycan biosynthesis class X protein isoform X2 n=1 Tax=Colius striatus TaxID=57412 RepID=UPI002B1E5DAE|nr:phosphatidylinositol-glycan biosynthesis class X protein isoform X2 [Colius striatus]
MATAAPPSPRPEDPCGLASLAPAGRGGGGPVPTAVAPHAGRDSGATEALRQAFSGGARRCGGARGEWDPRRQAAAKGDRSGSEAARRGPAMAAGRLRAEARRGAGLAALLCALHVQATCPGATVTQELLKEGFHRDLLVKVELGVAGEDTVGCTVAARIHLPPGIYVDPYELASLQQHNSTQAVLIPNDVDVEAPEYLATDLVVLLFLEPDPRCSRCFRGAVPVHARYHRPAEEAQQALVILKSPEVLACCCDNGLSAACWKPAEVEAPCSGKHLSPCQWYSLTPQPAQEELILQVPVGLRQHGSLVCVVTLLATVLSSSLILAAVCRYGHFPPVTC